ncbi:MAG: nucleotide sugar dehydrogenase [Dehalococcoidia bacterium]|jgi:UDP-N-acetyl-D-glucosamine dehydrogenase|nr:MAG: nucleotide sugar dehydrogenase [Dehalococcoidia bacterium]
MKIFDTIKKQVASRDYKVGIIGLGYVGLPLAKRFGKAGFKVLGFDVDAEKVRRLNEGSSYIHHIPSEQVSALVRSGRFEATADFDRLREADALIICVPTPLTRYREPDLQYVEKTADAIALTLRCGQLVCLESTTYPGTTEEVLLPRFTAGGLRVGEDFFLAFSPEREDPGNSQHTLEKVPKVVGGVTPECRELACTLYSQVIDRVVPVSSTRVAEAAKLLENIYRSVNVALVNELKVTFDRMGIDIWEVIEAAKTKPFGFQPFYPGPGLGGHCIPIDPFYLTWKAREYGISTRFIELAGEINHAMPAYVVQRLADALNERGKAVKGAKILVLGVSYKKDVGDLRESPSLEILEILLAKGARADYSDPYFPRLPIVRRHELEMESVPLTEDSVKKYDAVLVATDHSMFPYEMIHNGASLIVDSRNAFRQRGLVGAHVVGA